MPAAGFALISAPQQEGCEPSLGAIDRARFRILDGQQIEAVAEQLFRFARLAIGFGNQGQFGQRLGSQAGDRSDAGIANSDGAIIGGDQCIARCLAVAVDSPGGAQKLQRLGIDDLGAFLFAQFQFVDKTEQAAGSHTAIDPGGNRGGDFQTLGHSDLFDQPVLQREIDPFDRRIEQALIEQMDRLEIPLQPFGHRVAAFAVPRLLEQIVRFGKFTEIGFLPGPVDQIFVGDAVEQILLG